MNNFYPLRTALLYLLLSMCIVHNVSGQACDPPTFPDTGPFVPIVDTICSGGISAFDLIVTNYDPDEVCFKWQDPTPSDPGVIPLLKSDSICPGINTPQIVDTVRSITNAMQSVSYYVTPYIDDCTGPIKFHLLSIIPEPYFIKEPILLCDDITSTDLKLEDIDITDFKLLGVDSDTTYYMWPMGQPMPDVSPSSGMVTFADGDRIFVEFSVAIGTYNCTYFDTISVIKGDITDPVANCQNIDIDILKEEIKEIDASMIDLNSSDNCGITSYTLDKYLFDKDDAGENNITLTVKDAYDNTDTCVALISVTHIVPIPTLSQWAIIMLCLCLCIAGLIMIHRLSIQFAPKN